MSSFAFNPTASIPSSMDMVKSYIYNGEVELLKRVDMSVYTYVNFYDWVCAAKELKNQYSENKNSVKYCGGMIEKLNECIRILIDASNVDYTWETNKNMIIYAKCISDCSGVCYHKVFDKNTDTYGVIYCSELKENARSLGINNIHVNA